MSPMNSSRFICALVVFLSISQLGSCLQCYICQSATSADCVHVNDKTSMLDCGLQIHDVCIKSVIGNTVNRNCGVATACTTATGCYSCNTNLCNSSSGVVPSFIITSIVGLVAFKYFL